MTVQLTVVYNEYARYGTEETESPGIKTYKGKDEIDCLRKIAKAHSYGDPCEDDEYDDDEEHGEELTAKEIYDGIMAVNGDGCDYIVAIFEGKPKVYKPPRKR